MASTINTTNIDTEFPIAGQDNDSQGFRDNFTNTNTNFVAAKDEIEELQDNVVVKGALVLGGISADNDLSSTGLHSAQIRNFRGTVLNTGTVSGAVAIDVSVAPYQKITPTAAITLSFANFSAASTHSAVQVEIEITNTAFTVTLPGAVSIGIDGIRNVALGAITFPTAGTYILEFASTDNGATISIDDLTQSRIQVLSPVPLESVGSSGDKAGMMSGDSSYIYLCIADYDSVSDIWIRSANTGTWGGA